MKPSYFTEDAYDALLTDIDKNVSYYLQDKDWLEDYFQGQEYRKDSTIDFSFPTLYISSKRLADEDKTEEDIANVKIVYGNLKRLSPLQASNKYMWTCLSHTVYRDYVIHRWFDDDRLLASDEQKKVSRIRRTFFTTAGKRSLESNAIARLWWYGFASYDADNPVNPFHLTEFLVTNTKFCRDFMQSPCCENPAIGKGVLLAAVDFKETLKKNEGISGYYRYLKKYLNRYGAVTAIDFLDENEIYKLSLDYLNGLRKQHIVVENEEPNDLDGEEME